MFALLSAKAEYNDKVKPFIALAPIARLSNIRTPMKHGIPLLYAITK